MARKDRQYAIASQLVSLVDDARAGLKLTTAKVAERFGVKKAAALRYIKFARQHASLKTVVSGGRKVHVASTQSEQTFDRALALELACAAVPWLQGTRYATQLSQLVRDTKNQLLTADVDALDRMVRSFHIKRRSSPRTSRHSKIVDTLLGAIRARELCRITYTRLDGARNDYEVEPWTFNVIHDALFLIGRKLPDGGSRSFEVAHIEAVTCLGQTFAPPQRDEGDPSAMLRDTVGTYASNYGEVEPVVLRVRGTARVTLVRRPLHQTMTLGKADADGWSAAQLAVIVCPDLIAAVLALLPDVRVVEPPSLRESVRAAAMAVQGSDWDPCDP